tara:strand:- start:470 stop:673 length:204 start_codon:yes stop_codon:yes gene_type:complete
MKSTMGTIGLKGTNERNIFEFLRKKNYRDKGILPLDADNKHNPKFTKKIKSKRLLKKLKEQRANNTL